MAQLLTLPCAPRHVCLLRLSAIGDVCHALPLFHRLRHAWPEAQFTWIIGKVEAPLLQALSNVSLVIVDKRANRQDRHLLRSNLASLQPDLLLHLQVALRASRLARHIMAPVKLGFDRQRARDAQWLFTTHRIAARTHEHVLDSFMGFADALGVPATKLDLSLPLPDSAQTYARGLIRPGQQTLLVSPCSSHPARNWRVERYAAVIAAAQKTYGMQAILCGGPSELERQMGSAIESALASAGAAPVINQIGKDSLPQMQALLGRASALLTPDSGPAHMGSLAGIPVIGLYAATNPARSGPYRSLQWCVDRYDLAARRFRGRPAEALPWTCKIETPGVMDLIEVDDVLERLSALHSSRMLRAAA
jgi:heptosyltransferase I